MVLLLEGGVEDGLVFEILRGDEDFWKELKDGFQMWKLTHLRFLNV